MMKKITLFACFLLLSSSFASSEDAIVEISDKGPSVEQRLKELEKKVAKLEKQVEQLTPKVSTVSTYSDSFPEVLAQVRVVPYFRNGKSIGIRVFAIRRNSFWQRIGFLNGDIIIKIDDMPTTDVDSYMKAMKLILSDDGAKRRIEIEREGKIEFIDYVANYSGMPDKTADEKSTKQK